VPVAFPFRSALVVALAGILLSGCGSSTSCDVVGCLGGVHVTMSNLATTFSDDLPLTVSVCVGGACSSYRVEMTGQAPACVSLSGGTSTCTLDGMGSLVLSGLPLAAASGGTVSIEAKVTDDEQSLYDSTVTASVTENEPDGPSCGTCASAAAAFSP
jgi:hypothetical protein